MKVIVIGGVAAGMTAAMKLRRMNKDVEITVYEKGMDLSYSGCGMPYYIGDIVKEVDTLVARHQSDFENENINMRLSCEVIKIDAKDKKIWIKDLNDDKVFTDKFDKLIIAVGTKANRLNIDGGELENIFVLNQLKDARVIKSFIKKGQTAAIIGGGYIGIELAENLVKRGLKVIIFQRGNHVLNLYDDVFSQKVKDILLDLDVDIRFNEEILSYVKDEKHTILKTNKADYKLDLIVEAIGVKPNTEFLMDSGIVLAKNGAVITNDHMQTNYDDIYAAGDCVLYKHRLLNKQVFMPLGTHANKTGRVIAEHMMGINREFDGVIGSNVIKIGDYTFAKTGLGIKEAKKNGYDYLFVDIKENQITGFYPGAVKIHVRLVYEPKTGVLKGAQLYGKKGVSNRINVMAVAITKGLTAKEFSQLDLAYAPPFSPVWDPLLVAANQIKL